MRIISVEAANFASYDRLYFEFTDKGLTLVSGPTGSGKSTLCDIIPWVLFGVTAKDLAVDEVRSWNAAKPTTGTVNLGGMRITRIRGVTNDLFVMDDEACVRGKDLADTQRIINDMLGMDAGLYLSSLYFHEFSHTAQFFTAPAKTRRLIAEQIADLSFCKKLSDRLVEHKRDIKLLQETLEKDLAEASQASQFNSNLLLDTRRKSREWIKDNAAKHEELLAKYDNFNVDKEYKIGRIQREHTNKRIEIETDLASYIAALEPDEIFVRELASLKEKEQALGDGTCSECGAPSNTSQRMIITKARHSIELRENENNQIKTNILFFTERLRRHEEKLPIIVAEEQCRVNSYSEQIERLKTEKNPHETELIEEALNSSNDKKKRAELDVEETAIDTADADLLSQVNDKYRSSKLNMAMASVQSRTNQILSDYFEGILTVKFDTATNDRVDVAIMKDGNTASFQQLSKGQRAVLKLAFGVSVMKTVSDRHGMDLNVAMFDESLDGMSEALKLQAFRLFESLQNDYESIFVIDHSVELKACFNNRYEVELIDGKSEIKEA